MLTEHFLKRNQSTRASLTSIEKDDSPRSSYTVDVQDYQSLKELEDHVTDFILCLDSTLDTATTLADMYLWSFCGSSRHSERSEYLPGRHCEYDELYMLLNEKIKDVQYSRKKAEALLTKAKNTRGLVRDPSSGYTTTDRDDRCLRSLSA